MNNNAKGNEQPKNAQVVEMLPPVPVVTKAVENNVVPQGLVVNYGDAVVTADDDKVDVIRKYIRNKVLNQFGVTGHNKETVSQLPIGFNVQNVQTRLKLPKVKTDLAGEYIESVPQYYTRALPAVALWLKNAIRNSNITTEQIGNME